MTRDRRFIEETFPVQEVGKQAAREKSIRHGHISTLHIWWARRPLAASRATAYAALIAPPETDEELRKQRRFIANLCKWESSLDTHALEAARRAIYQAHAERLSRELGRPVTVEDIEAGRVPPPRVLDPFAGGGSYPLEALRLGCEAHAGDYNPVAVLILKATLEYPQRWCRPFDGMPADLQTLDAAAPDDGNPQQTKMDDEVAPEAEGSRSAPNPLLTAVRYWGNRVLETARGELAEFYRSPYPDETVIGYIWARTLPCQNLSCGAEIPLMRQFWLAKKKGREIALQPVVKDGRVDFEIVARGEKAEALPGHPYAEWPEGFDPKRGTVSRAVVTCPVCGATISANDTRRLFREGRSGQRMVAVVVTRNADGRRRGSGKYYRLPTQADLDAYAAAGKALAVKRKQLRSAWGIDPVPDEMTPEGKGSGAERAFSVRNYGLDAWGKLFNSRQLLSLITFAEGVRLAHAEMLARGYPQDFARAVTTYLALILGRLTDSNSVQCWWQSSWEKEAITFARQALQMTWDHFEMSPFAEKGYRWRGFLNSTTRVIENVSLQCSIPSVSQASATRLPYPDDHFDAVLTDPPYYDNVPYSYLSDFFYVWLKRTVGHLYPDLFVTPLTPKGEEIVAYSVRDGQKFDGKKFFEEMLVKAFREIHRVLKPGGIAVIVYAYKTTAGWETVINALLESGLVVGGAWPIDTEMKSRLRANESAALASSIYIVARKAESQGVGFYPEVKEELRRYLDVKLRRLWEEGVKGADFFIAAIGSAIEVFGKYEKVMDYEGNVIRADKLLSDVRIMATDFAVRQILHNGFHGEVSDLTRFYVLWRWNYGEARVHFDEARKLAQSCGLDLTEEWGRKGSFIRKAKEFVRVLGPAQRDVEELAESNELIDVLHHVLLLWERDLRDEMVERLTTSGYGNSEAFYRVAQAISESLPVDSKEKRLLEGLLTGRDRLRQDVRQARLL